MIFLMFLLSCTDMFDSSELTRKRSDILKVASTKSFEIEDIDHDALKENVKNAKGNIPDNDLLEIWDGICKMNSTLFSGVTVKLLQEEKAVYLQNTFTISQYEEDVKGHKVEVPETRQKTEDKVFKDFRNQRKNKFNTPDKIEMADKDTREKAKDQYTLPMGDGQVYLYLKNNIFKSNIKKYMLFDKKFYDKVYTNTSKDELERIQETLNSYCYRFVYEIEKKDEQLELRIGIEIKKKGAKNKSLINLFKGVL